MRNVLKVIAVLISALLLVAAAQADDTPVLYGRDQLAALLENVSGDIQPGTAGSALRATARAAEMMKWGLNTDMTSEEITDTVNEIVDSVSEDEKPDFDEAMSEIYFAYCNLLVEGYEDALSDAGCDPNEYDFGDIESIEAVEVIMTAVGAIS